MKYTELFIKIGDSETCIYKKGSGLVLKEASLIAFSKKGKRINIVEVGNSAKELLGKTDGSIWVEAPFKSGIIDNKELAKLLLSKFISLAVVDSSHKIKATFFVNCSLTAEEKRDYELLALSVGIFNYSFVPSAVASLVGAGCDVEDVSGKMIVDFGADCTEIAVVSKASIVSGHSIELGGNIIDSAIVSYVFETFNVVISEVSAEKIKKEVGSLHQNDVANITFTGYDALTRSAQKNTIFAKDLYTIFEAFFDKIIEGCEIVLNQLSADLINDIARNGIYLCGGISQITGIESYFKKRLNVPIYVYEQPELLCMEGAKTLSNDENLIQKIVANN